MVANPFNDDFADGVIGPDWIHANGSGAVTEAGGVLSIGFNAGAVASFSSAGCPFAALAIDAGCDFYFQAKLASLVVTAGVNPSAVGIALGISTSSELYAIVEFGGTSNAAQKLYVSYVNENEIGRKLTAVAPAIPVYVRALRLDDIVYAQTSQDGVTWTNLAATPVIERRRGDISESPVEGDRILLYARSSHDVDTAGVTGTWDNVYMTTWPRYSAAPRVGQLVAKSFLEGSRVDLSWALPQDGADKVRSLKIVRSLMACAELPVDTDRFADPPATLIASMTAPYPQPTPSNADEWKEDHPSVQAPTYLFTHNGVTLADVLGGAGAFASAGIGAVDFVASARAIGINGGSMEPLQAVEVLGTATGAFTSPVATAPVAGLDQTFGFIFRVTRVPTAARRLVSVCDNASAHGWAADVMAGGVVRVSIFDSGDTLSFGDVTDGAWHVLLVGFDWGAGQWVATLDGAAVSVGALPLPAFGAVNPLVFGAAGGVTGACAQLFRAHVWSGVGAASIRETAIANIFKLGSVPFADDLPEHVTAAYARTGPAAGGWNYAKPARDQLGYEYVAKYAPNQFWMGSNNGYDHQTKMDGRFGAAVANILGAPSEECGTLVTANNTSSVVEAPDGSHTAQQITQTGLDGRVTWTVPGLAANTSYVVSLWVWADAPRDVTIWLRDQADTAVTINSKNEVYAQPQPRRVSFTIATGIETGMTIRLYGGKQGVDVAGIVMFWGLMVEVGTVCHDYVPIPVGATTKTRGTPSLVLSFPAGTIPKLQGEVRARAVRLAMGTGVVGTIASAEYSGGASDKLLIEASAADAAQFVVDDGTGAAIANLTSGVTWTTPQDVRGEYRADAPLTGLANYCALVVGAVIGSQGRNAVWVPSGDIDRIYIGADSAGANTFGGGIASVGFWTGNAGIDHPIIPYGVGLDPLGEVIYDGDPISAYTDASLVPGRFYHYTLFTSRAPDAPVWTTPLDNWKHAQANPGVTDLGPHAPADNRVVGLAIRDLVTRDGKYLYNLLPNYHREKAEEQRIADGRTTALEDDIITFQQRGIDLVRELSAGAHLAANAETGPLGLVGSAWTNEASLTSNVDAALADVAVNPQSAGLLASAKRRMWRGIVKYLRVKGSIGSLPGLVELITGWRGCQVEEPGAGTDLRVLRTWDGFSQRVQIDIAANLVTFAAGKFSSPSLALVPDHFANGLFLDWFGNVRGVTTNDATSVTLDDATFTPYAQLVYTGVPIAASVATLPAAANDDAFNDGQVHEASLGASVNITATNWASKSITAAGLPNSAGTSIAIAKSYTGAWGARVPMFEGWLMRGAHSWLYESKSDLTLRGTSKDPFFITWPGLDPVGTGTATPITPDDVIVWPPQYAARRANLKAAKVATNVIVVRGHVPDGRPGDWVNPNRNQATWWRIVEIYQAGAYTVMKVDASSSLTGLSLDDVAERGDLVTVVPQQTLENDRAIRALLPQFLPLNSRVFVYYS